jgi:hypothetical protein
MEYWNLVCFHPHNKGSQALSEFDVLEGTVLNHSAVFVSQLITLMYAPVMMFMSG